MPSSPPSFQPIALDSPSLHYLHPTSAPPPTCSKDGTSAVLLTAPKSDWWHTPSRDSQDGLAWGSWVDLKDEGFELRVKAGIKHQNRVSEECSVLPLG